ncbi:MAG TPA: chemotaxis protein CheB, partial [Thermoanaerobaculia bacterium]|nr:chemotaxis protein CheB [Thermoanaerobaculia bacterium]
YGRRVIAVVMTGNLDDGTAGLALVKRLGGVAVVQDPEDADYPSMPESAIAHVEVDYVVPVANIGSLLDRLVHEPLPEQDEELAPEEREEVSDMSEQEERDGSVAGEPAGLVCPDCGGSLFEKPGVEPLHFRCRTGHAYSPESLIARQTDGLEAALWASMRALQENAALARRMERRARQNGGNGVGERYHKRAEDAEKHARFLRTLLQQGGADLE